VSIFGSRAAGARAPVDEPMPVCELANPGPLRDRLVAAVLTFDRAQRKALYQKEEERIHALVPAVFFYWENEYNAVNSDAKNIKPAAFIQDTWNAWEWEI